jgi:glycosyltransferase involved in cell wall biosynthesis
MKISIVIPVYNEASQLSDCLDSIAAQTLSPFEVIVVDNNSTDDTAVVALRYDFVKVISEPKQGVVHARTTGFNLAKGEIIARIDGDTILPKDWLSNLQRLFAAKNIHAVSGKANYYGVAAASLIDKMDLFFRRRLSKQLQKNMYLWGANMALRRNAWEEVRNHLCIQNDIHEDFDLAIHLEEIHRNVVFDESLAAHVSSRRIDMTFLSFMHYVMVSPRTYEAHGINVRRAMYPVVAVCAIFYLPGFILHRGYDDNTGKFSYWHLLESQSKTRTDPTTNVA